MPGPTVRSAPVDCVLVVEASACRVEFENLHTHGGGPVEGCFVVGVYVWIGWDIPTGKLRCCVVVVSCEEQMCAGLPESVNDTRETKESRYISMSKDQGKKPKRGCALRVPGKNRPDVKETETSN